MTAAAGLDSDAVSDCCSDAHDALMDALAAVEVAKAECRSLGIAVAETFWIESDAGRIGVTLPAGFDEMPREQQQAAWEAVEGCAWDARRGR